MRKTHFLFFTFIILFFFSCKEKKDNEFKSPIDTGRLFIQEIRNGEFKSAETLLVKNSENERIFVLFKKDYENLVAEKKIELKNSPYIINSIDEIKDSVYIINYSNGISGRPKEIKIVRNDKQWAVDLRHSSPDNLPFN